MQFKKRGKIIPRMTAKRIQAQEDSSPVSLESKQPRQVKAGLHEGWLQQKERKEQLDCLTLLVL